MVDDEIRIVPRIEQRPSIGPIRVSVLADVEQAVGERAAWPGARLRPLSFATNYSGRELVAFSEEGLPRLRLLPHVCANYRIRVLAPGFQAESVSDLTLPTIAPGGQMPTNTRFDLWGSELQVRMRRTVWLRFTGRELAWLRNGRVEKSWSAVSGAAGHQDPANQGLRDKGPLPVGTYLADLTDLQDRNQDVIDWGKGLVGRGRWPGNDFSWGDHRLWLRPLRGTNTLGREGFSIHGGLIPGSAGCIDLTGSMNDFVGHLRAYGQSVTVDVAYS
ncbi:DUF2778 domain-containing protein [Inquilinus limosus]|uniref:hypothetical protein n=1 Tax=Inquilinus limosus TaxID=171674 RepID=UPI003F17FEC5